MYLDRNIPFYKYKDFTYLHSYGYKKLDFGFITKRLVNFFSLSEGRAVTVFKQLERKLLISCINGGPLC